MVVLHFNICQSGKYLYPNLFWQVSVTSSILNWLLAHSKNIKLIFVLQLFRAECTWNVGILFVEKTVGGGNTGDETHSEGVFCLKCFPDLYNFTRDRVSAERYGFSSLTDLTDVDSCDRESYEGKDIEGKVSSLANSITTFFQLIYFNYFGFPIFLKMKPFISYYFFSLLFWTYQSAIMHHQQRSRIVLLQTGQHLFR